MTFQAYKRLNPSARVGDFEARIAPDADRQATLARLEREYAHPAPGPPQTIADFGGVQVVTDKMSAPYLMGATIDFVDTIEKQGFTIDNPNATGSCACGDSFH